MNLANARTWIRRFARNAMDSAMYADEDLDRSLMVVGADFCARARGLVHFQIFALNLDDGSITFDASSLGLASGTPITPETLIDLTVSDGGALPVIPWGEYNALVQANGADLQGRPRAATIAGMDATAQSFAVLFWPAQDTTPRSITARVYVNFPVWTPGTPASNVASLNLPDHFLMPILTKGAPAVLQANEPEHKYTAAAWAEYEKFRDGIKGRGSLGVRVAERAMQE